MTLSIRIADLDTPADQAAIEALHDHYARQPFGNGGPLPPEVTEQLIPGLKARPNTLVFLASQNQTDVGMAITFTGFSTFKAATLLNIHDFVVLDSCRGQGIGGQMLDAISEYAQQQGWCAITLEVESDNPARRLYDRKGFQGLNQASDKPNTLSGKRLITKART